MVCENNGKLTTGCQRELEATDLKFHDLQRESGSRFFAHGMAPHDVQAFLGHANLSTTTRYLNITAQGMHAALERVQAERGIRCASPGPTDQRRNARVA
jgi:integrase